MGFCGSKMPSNPIDDDIKRDRKSHAVKLLLLGAGESGKSTIAKQVKLIHLKGFTEPEVLSYKSTIHQNIISSVQSLIQGAQDFGYEFSEEGKEAALLLQKQTADAIQDTDVIEAVKLLWNREVAIKNTWARSSELQIIESTSYYLNDIDRIVAANYRPTDIDILHTRIKTTGIIEISFKLEGFDFRLVDVGGQRSERRKWLHCFQDVTAILFCVSMSEYDQMLHEDHNVKRTEESMKLFGEICNSKWFGDVDIILFLNKYDLFKEKVQKVDMKCAFPDYDGGLDVKKGREFVRDKYLSLNHNENKEIYHHITTATNTENIKSVFADVVEIIIKKGLRASGLGGKGSL